MKQPTQKQLENSKRPMLFYQKGNGKSDLVDGDRLRLVYLDGNIEWATCDDSINLNEKYCFNIKPCYLERHTDTKIVDIIPTSLKHALSIINDHDEKQGWKKQKFLGFL